MITPLTGKRMVIFGCGYVGAAVAAHALASGVQVTALTRNAAKALLLREQGLETVVADLASTDWHPAIAGSPDFVLNCVSSGGVGLEGYRHSYVDGMSSILDWATRHGAANTMLYTGSTSVYPQGDGAVVDESSSTEPASERARLLLEAEHRLRAATGAWRRWFILRLAGIYGPGRHHLLEQVRAGEVAGVGSHRLNLVHRDDIVTAVMACFAAPAEVANEVFNVADDEPTRKSEVVSWLASRMNLPVPRFTGEPAGGRRAVTPDRVISNAKCKAVLNWRPRYPSFREGYDALLSC